MSSDPVIQESRILGLRIRTHSLDFEIEGHAFQFHSEDLAVISRLQEVIDKVISPIVDSHFQCLLKFEQLIEIVSSKKVLENADLNINGVKLSKETAGYFDGVVCQIADAIIPRISPRSFEDIFKFQEKYAGIFQVVVGSELLLSYAFLRIQEYYESPKFKDEVFSRAQFVEWYSKECGQHSSGESFTYYRDWVGFNIPSSVADSFLKAKFPDILPVESYLIQALEKAFIKHRDSFYIIGFASSCQDWTIEHEVAHALYSLDPAYRAEINQVLGQLSEEQQEVYRTKLISFGYDEGVLEDETHAYLIHLDQNYSIFKLEPTDSVYQGLLPIHQAIAGIYHQYLDRRNLDSRLSDAELPRSS